MTASPVRRRHLYHLCNKRAAEATARTNKGTQPQQTGPMITTDKTRDQQAPGSIQPGSPTNPTGGRITDSTRPGTPPSAIDGTVSPDVLKGMAPSGQGDTAYQQSYLVCMRQLGY
jgi:hypothetical protein